MGKKAISKRSRAARRLEVEEPEAQSLANLPRSDKTDFASSLIRTANKNEQLLEAKLNKRKKYGKVNKNPSSSLLGGKDKLQRALNITSRLDGKIQKSISRAKYVQSARKAGWEATNLIIRKEFQGKEGDSGIEKMKESELDKMDDGEEIEPYDSAQPETAEANKLANAFAALDDEVEA